MITTYANYAAASAALLEAKPGDILVYPNPQRRWWPLKLSKEKAIIVTSRTLDFILFREIDW